MRIIQSVAGAILTLAIPSVGAASAPVASADPGYVDAKYAVNGTYAVVSDGQWAKTLDVFRDRPTVAATWTISSTCATPYICTGQVSSDQGWTAELHMRSGLWQVSREGASWEPCPDGSARAGRQTFAFYWRDATTLAGVDKTIGVSGDCGINLPLVIEMPFKGTKLPPA